MYKQKRAIAVHDLSGYGRCALSVVLPVLSLFGVETVAVPTTILSTHTGGFENMARYELTDYMSEAFAHYQRLGLEFDYIYSGYLGNAKQIQVCKNFFQLHPDSLILVDPVMGDNGTAYQSITVEMQEQMVDLVHHANVIVPNLTEACILLGREYSGETVTRESAKEMLQELAELGPKWVVITGAIVSEGRITNVAYNRDSDEFFAVETNHIPVSYPGTGDIFASTLVGGLARGLSLPEAMTYATRFIKHVVRFSYENKTETRSGVLLEPCLRWLLEEHEYMGYTIL